MYQIFKIFLTVYILAALNFTGSALPPEIINNISSPNWKTKPLTPGKTSLYGQGKYIIISSSPILKRGLILHDDYNNKKAPFLLEFDAAENITVYVFMYSNKSKWSSWPKSRAFIKWEYTKKNIKKVSKYFMRYKRFPKGKVTLEYNPAPEAGTRPFFIIVPESITQKNITEPKEHPGGKMNKQIGDSGYTKEAPYKNFMLWPRPKFIKRINGSIRLDNLQLIDLAKAPNTTSFLKEELRKKYNFSFKKKSNNSLIISLLKDSQTEKILKNHQLNGKLTGKYPDAFIIVITDTGILITGNNNRGLYYGIRAFLNIIDYSTPTGEKPIAACMNVADWPDQKMRILFWRMDTMRNTKPDLVMIKRYIRDAIAGSRYNAIVFMMRGGLRYKSHPEIARKTAFSTDEFKDLVAFAEKHYLEPIPGINVPGHAQWILKRHKELGELNNGVICTKNPETLKFVFDIAREMIELCGGRKVRYFHTGGDEVRWERFDRKYKRIREKCERCQGIPRKKLLLDFIKQMHTFFSKRGIRMIMWSDMFDENRNGAHYKTSEILDGLPRDIILSPWSALGYPKLKKYKKMGFEVIKGATGYKVISVFDDISLGHMLAYFSSNMWMTFNTVKMSSHNYYNHLSTYLYGSNAWNNDKTLKPRDKDEWNNIKATVQKRGEKKKLDFLMKYGNALTYYQNKKRFPAETNKFTTINLSEYCNKERANCFNAGKMFDLSGLKNGRQDIAGIPTEIGEKVIVLPKGNVKNIKIAQKASSVIFLYAAYLDTAKEKEFIKRIRYNPEFQISSKRNPIAYYTINYADGSTEKVTMNYGFNVGALRPPLHSRYTYDIRHVHRATAENQYWPEVKDCRDCSPGAPAVYQWEWVNPYPKKEIVSIDFISMNTEVVPALVAITVRKIKG